MNQIIHASRQDVNTTLSNMDLGKPSTPSQEVRGMVADALLRRSCDAAYECLPVGSPVQVTIWPRGQVVAFLPSHNRKAAQRS